MRETRTATAAVSTIASAPTTPATPRAISREGATPPAPPALPAHPWRPREDATPGRGLGQLVDLGDLDDEGEACPSLGALDSPAANTRKAESGRDDACVTVALGVRDLAAAVRGGRSVFPDLERAAEACHQPSSALIEPSRARCRAGPVLGECRNADRRRLQTARKLSDGSIWRC